MNLFEACKFFDLELGALCVFARGRFLRFRKPKSRDNLHSFFPKSVRKSLDSEPQPSMGTVQHQPILRDRAPLSAAAATTTQGTMPTPLYPAITSNKPLLRVGVMLDDWTVPAWVADVLASIQDSGVAMLTTVILNREPRPAPRNLAERLKRVLSAKSAGLGTLLWDRYVRSDQRRNPDFATPFHPTDVHSLLAGARAIDVVPMRNGLVHRFNAADIAAVKRDSLDVIVRFGFNSLSGEILSAARYGVWSYHHGDNNKYRGGPAGFWEMYERNPLTAAILQILTEDHRWWPGDLSRLRGDPKLRVTGGEPLLALPEGDTVRRALPAESLRAWTGWHTRRSESSRLYAPPLSYSSQSPHAAIFHAHPMEYLVVGIQNRLKVQRDHWFLAVARGVAPGQQLTGKVSPLHPPRGRFWADPMIVRSNGQAFMFFEDYDYGLRRGHISVVELDASGRAGAPRTALQADYHSLTRLCSSGEASTSWFPKR